jgi:hypothetical protein
MSTLTEQRLADLSAFIETHRLIWKEVAKRADVNYTSFMQMKSIGTVSPAQMDKMEAAALNLAKERHDSLKLSIDRRTIGNVKSQQVPTKAEA